MRTSNPDEPERGPAVLALTDLVRGHLGGVTSIMAVTGPDLDLELRLDLAHTDVEHTEDGSVGQSRVDLAAFEGARLGPDTLAVVPLGPDPARQFPLEVFGQVAQDLPEGARGLLLLGYAPAQLPYQQILSMLAELNCLILQVAALDEASFGSAIVFTRADAAPPSPSGHVSAPAGQVSAPAGQGSALRNMNEYALGRFVAQALRARLAHLDRAAAGARDPDAQDPRAQDPPAQAAHHPGGPAGTAQAGVTLERDRLARALRSTQHELVGVQEKLLALERSISLEVGRAVVGAAKRPWREGSRLPRDLYRLWRERGGAAISRRNEGDTPDGVGAALTSLQDRGGPGLGDRWLAAFTTPGEGAGDAGKLVITGALTALSCATLAPDAVVAPLLPHDADFVLEGTGADLVLIETAAMLPGCGWAYADDPAATDRGRRLAALVSLARSLGKPVVLLRNTGWQLTAGLDWLAASCDAVIDGDLGVQLARFNPIGLDPARPRHPLYAARRDLREPRAVRLILDELTDGDGPAAVSGAVGWRSAPSLYRGHGLFVAATDAQAREQLAAGARVVGPVGAAVTESGGVAAPDAARATEEIEAAVKAGARGPAEIRPVLREIFEHHATPARLTGLARLLGLPADAAASRRIAVLAEVPDASHAQRLGHDLMRQRLRPAEVIVSLAGPHPDAASAVGRQAAARALRGLADSGATVRVIGGTGLPAAAAAAHSPWVAPWAPDRDHQDCYLLDLACALECSRADAVGRAPAADYVFAQAIEPALARRDLLLPDAPAADAWGRHGLRMLAISP
jgi:hypothetical protein